MRAHPLPVGLATVLLGTLAVALAQAPQPTVVVLELTGIIGPASSDFVVRGLDRAERSDARAVVLRIDTPGGLDTSMREIISRILASDVPVVAWVGPQGARAASAGTYILYASHVAAMAPATNLGAATPVQLTPGGLPSMPEADKGRAGDTPGANGNADSGDKPAADAGEQKQKPARFEPTTPMERKLVNDAVAYIRGLALERGRNAEWAERAVREGVSLTASDALRAGVIELLARDVTELLERLDGREIRIGERTVRLVTAGVPVTVVTPDWRNRLLALLTNPNVAYVLMLLGIYGLFFELANPGQVLPGVAGAISLVLALYAFHVLPVNWAGFALIALGLAFMTAEVFVPSFGALGIGGAVALVVGSLILVDTGVEAFALSIPLVVAVAGISVLFVLSVVTLALRQRHRPVVSGIEQMIGIEGEALEDFTGEGRVLLHGETWTARSRVHIGKGQRLRVRAIDGLVAEVEPVTEDQ